MDYLYSLYDALVSINVPNDKARAVVDAMERDMGTTLATKADLENLRLATKADLQSLSQATKADLHSLSQATKADLQSFSQATKAELQFLRLEMATKSDLAEVRQECAVIGKDIEILSGKMAALSKDITVRLGSTMLALVMLLFTALKLT